MWRIVLCVASCSGFRTRTRGGRTEPLPDTDASGRSTNAVEPTSMSRPSPLSTTANHPARDTCVLASGFSVAKGCSFTAATQDLPRCAGGQTQACRGSSVANLGRDFSLTVENSEEFSSLTNVVVEVEGGGYGASVSVGFSYLKSSNVAERSSSFFRGQSSQIDAEVVENTGEIKLKDSARGMLTSGDFDRFLDTFGPKFVHKVIRGGSFLGSCTCNARQTSDTQDISVFTTINAQYGVYSGTGSAQFESKRSSMNSKVEVGCDARFSGGSGVSRNFSNPAAINSAFLQWAGTVQSTPVPLLITVRSWFDSQQVATALGEGNATSDVYAKFTSPPIAMLISDLISAEHAKVILLQESAKRALDWRATQRDSILKSCLNGVKGNLDSKLLAIAGMDDPDAMEIQQDYQQGKVDWFVADGLENTYKSCIYRADITCRLYPHYCYDWQKLIKSEYDDWCHRSPSCDGDSAFPSSTVIQSITSAHSDTDNLALRTKLRTAYPGWEWAVAKWSTPDGGRRRRRRRWGYAGLTRYFGEKRGGDTLVAMGTACQSGPQCETCPIIENCVADKFSVNDDMPQRVQDAWDNCLGSGSKADNILAKRPDTYSIAWYARPQGFRCLVYGQRHSKFYMFHLRDGVSASVAASVQQTGAASNATGADAASYGTDVASATPSQEDLAKHLVPMTEDMTAGMEAGETSF